jgi:hypothetical protein
MLSVKIFDTTNFSRLANSNRLAFWESMEATCLVLSSLDFLQ